MANKAAVRRFLKIMTSFFKKKELKNKGVEGMLD